MKLLPGICLFFLLLAGGCTWVKPTDAGMLVSVSTFEQVAACGKLGKVTVNVLDSIGFIPRSERKMAEELQTMAKNSAAEMNGDTIVAVSKVTDGEQAFNVYRCGK
ncbi:protein of unknown function (DUF4156) [Mariprofundus ferrinatatus]|uniref:DUF4156 domain-containing protein n=1 Tax=Mariprofundus ferrinatatus TaxID=1921087 RepID=A0A2K8L2D6_9PROT|nr:DUF4156 domain-containing protein [Mariprofundus ferrinatatus]ATX81262.1 protein of unknown function (DUF4156) [Mariprofundus ferrinatatus]